VSSATYVSYPGGGGGKVAETKLVDEPSKVAAAEDGVEEPVLAPSPMTNDGEVLDGVEGLPFPFPVPFPPDPFHDDRLPKWDDKDFPDFDDIIDKFDDKDWDDVKKNKKKHKKKKTRSCFPGTSTVTLADGTTKSMASLQLGDEVLDAAGAYSPIYVFGHASAAKASYLTLALEGGRKITLSPDHYVPANGDLVYAKDVAVGDVLGYVDGGATETAAVASIDESVEVGMYNPYTLSGTIVVDGVVASCHSSWILDGLAPPRVLAKVYQRLFVVPRAAYKLIGAEGMDSVFGVGNNGATASVDSQTAMLFGVVGACALTLVLAGAGAKAVLGV